MTYYRPRLGRVAAAKGWSAKYTAWREANPIREQRMRFDLSQSQLAQLSGVSASEIEALESGRRLRPGARSLQQLAHAMRFSLDDLAAGFFAWADRRPDEPKTRVDAPGDRDGRDVPTPKVTQEAAR